MAETVEVTVGPQGRLVIPARLRRRLGLETGDVLVARVQDDRLVFERRQAILARIRRALTVVPDGVSMVDELIAERGSISISASQGRADPLGSATRVSSPDARRRSDRASG